MLVTIDSASLCNFTRFHSNNEEAVSLINYHLALPFHLFRCTGQEVSLVWALFLSASHSSRSSGRVRYRNGGKKHEIYVPTFGGHLLMTYFSQGKGPSLQVTELVLRKRSE